MRSNLYRTRVSDHVLLRCISAGEGKALLELRNYCPRLLTLQSAEMHERLMGADRKDPSRQLLSTAIPHRIRAHRGDAGRASYFISTFHITRTRATEWPQALRMRRAFLAKETEIFKRTSTRSTDFSAVHRSIAFRRSAQRKWQEHTDSNSTPICSVPPLRAAAPAELEWPVQFIDPFAPSASQD